MYATKESSELTITAGFSHCVVKYFVTIAMVMNLTEGPIIQLRYFRHCMMQRFCSGKYILNTWSIINFNI